mgnify:CR=1 FL=1
MATEKTYNGDGSDTTFDITFPYLTHADIKVFLKEVKSEATAVYVDIGLDTKKNKAITSNRKREETQNQRPQLTSQSRRNLRNFKDQFQKKNRHELRDGTETENFTPGIELHAKQTIFSEGSRGSLTKVLFDQFNLRSDADPQTYAIGIKELLLVLLVIMYILQQHITSILMRMVLLISLVLPIRLVLLLMVQFFLM